MAKRGPKPKIGPKEEAEIFACLTVGASMMDAADYLGIDVKTIRNHRKTSPKFSLGSKKAVSKGKLHHLNKIGKAPQWQASAFMLQSKWGAEYGRKEQVQHTGKGGGPIKLSTTTDLSKLTIDELTTFETLLRKANESADAATDTNDVG